MKLGKMFLALLAVAWVGSFVVMPSSLYALGQEQTGQTTLDEADKRTDDVTNGTKRSALHAGETLIGQQKKEGNVFSRQDLISMRQGYQLSHGKTEADKKISPAMVDRERKDLGFDVVGVFEEQRLDDGTIQITMAADITEQQWNKIDEAYQQIGKLAKNDTEEGRTKIGLNTYSASEQLTSSEKIEARKIAGEVLLTGKKINIATTATGKANPLFNLNYEGIVTVTDRQVVGDRALTSDNLAKKIDGVGIGGKKLVIVTPRDLNEEKLSPEDQAYVSDVIAALTKAGLANARDLLERDDPVIVFSKIFPATDIGESIYEQIEGMPIGTPTPLNNLNPAQAKAVLKRV
jgi:hypothetical protein